MTDSRLPRFEPGEAEALGRRFYAIEKARVDSRARIISLRAQLAAEAKALRELDAEVTQLVVDYIPGQFPLLEGRSLPAEPVNGVIRPEHESPGRYCSRCNRSLGSIAAEPRCPHCGNPEFRIVQNPDGTDPAVLFEGRVINPGKGRSLPAEPADEPPPPPKRPRGRPRKASEPAIAAAKPKPEATAELPLWSVRPPKRPTLGYVCAPDILEAERIARAKWSGRSELIVKRHHGDPPAGAVVVDSAGASPAPVREGTPAPAPPKYRNPVAIKVSQTPPPEPAESRAPAEPMDPIDVELMRALHRIEGADERWKRLVRTGATNPQLRQEIGEAFGIFGGASGNGRLGYAVNGGANPRIWIPADLHMDSPPTLKGLALVARVRSLLNIPLPRAAAAAAPAKARPQSVPASPTAF